MRLLGRGRQESLIGAYEKPPAMPEDTYYTSASPNRSRYSFGVLSYSFLKTE